MTALPHESDDVSTPPPSSSALSDPVIAPEDFRKYVDGIGGLLAGSANVVMQLGRPEVAYGVYESKVESGRIDRHPFKRARTTLTYLAVALLGSDEDRAAYREAVNTAHRQVRSNSDSPVKYNAFDPELQLWVAACLYYGARYVERRLHGELPREVQEWFYGEAKRLATTLQVPAELWPADIDAFDAYWNEAVQGTTYDDTIRDYLLGVLKFDVLPWWLWPLAKPMGFMNTGFLPAHFRDQLGVAWGPLDEKVFQAIVTAVSVASRPTPRIVRNFPLNAYLWDMRLRRRLGRPLV